MGLFDIFKKKKQDSKEEKKTPPIEVENVNNSSEDSIYGFAYASMRYEELGNEYGAYKKELLNSGIEDSKFIYYTIFLILKFYYASEKTEALNLYRALEKDYPDNENIIWLFIEVICIIDIKNSQDFAERYLSLKKQNHDFNHHYQIEYQKGLELKSKGYYKEAIELWKSLNRIHEFSWNYYQIGILQHSMNDGNCLNNIRKGIEMDETVKEDAKSYYELEGLRTNQEFLKLIE